MNRKVAGILSLILVLCFLGPTYQASGETRSLRPNDQSSQVVNPEWKFFTNVLELLLFQPGRAMGTPWPEKGPYEFTKLFNNNEKQDFCER